MSAKEVDIHGDKKKDKTVFEATIHPTFTPSQYTEKVTIRLK